MKPSDLASVAIRDLSFFDLETRYDTNAQGTQLVFLALPVPWPKFSTLAVKHLPESRPVPHRDSSAIQLVENVPSVV
jgi:hypothetical protein